MFWIVLGNELGSWEAISHLPGTRRKFVLFIEILSPNRHHLGCQTEAPILMVPPGCAACFCVAIVCFKEFWVRCIPGKRWEFCFSFHRTKPFGDTALKIYTSPFSEVGKHTSATLKCALKNFSGSFMMFLDKIWSLRPVLECINRSSFVKMGKVELWEVETKWITTKLRWSQRGSMLQHFKRCRTQFLFIRCFTLQPQHFNEFLNF